MFQQVSHKPSIRAAAETGATNSFATEGRNMPVSARRWLLFGVLCAGGFVAGGWAWWKDQRSQSAMEEIERSVMAGHYATACRDLEQLLTWKTDANGGIVYLLGSCELARGRDEAAAAAWARVAPGSAFAERALRGRLRLLIESGRLAPAEELISGAARDRRNDRTAVLALVAMLFRSQDRVDEATRLVEDRWEHLNQSGEGALEPAIKLLLDHIEWTRTPTPVAVIRALIEPAARLAPDDDRVWLGRARLAIRTGAYEDAAKWLGACEKRRPDDAPVRRARLAWAMATDQIDAAEQAVAQLPAQELTPAEQHRALAWLAAKRGDAEAERGALDRLLAVEPADLTAIERLAELRQHEGRTEQAALLRRRKDEIRPLQARYEKLFARKQPIRDAVEMARLAERLGRLFEARAFLTLAIADDPRRTDQRHDLERLRAPAGRR
jgi:enediyne biosynthesis protein E4